MFDKSNFTLWAIDFSVLLYMLVFLSNNCCEPAIVLFALLLSFLLLLRENKIPATHREPLMSVNFYLYNCYFLEVITAASGICMSTVIFLPDIFWNYNIASLWCWQNLFFRNNNCCEPVIACLYCYFHTCYIEKKLLKFGGLTNPILHREPLMTINIYL